VTFDKTRPTNTEKIRDLGTVIRPNWEAIEEAQSSFRPYAVNNVDRTAEPIAPEDPVAIANTLISFCKEDAGGTPRLFTIDPGSNILQVFAGTLTDHGGGNYTLVTGLGIIVKFGYGSANNTGFANTFPVAFPTTAGGVLMTPRTAGATFVSFSGLTVAGFTGWLQAGPGTQVITYIAWGT
jgi:hypothetical protein